MYSFGLIPCCSFACSSVSVKRVSFFCMSKMQMNGFINVDFLWLTGSAFLLVTPHFCSSAFVSLKRVSYSCSSRMSVFATERVRQRGLLMVDERCSLDDHIAFLLARLRVGDAGFAHLIFGCVVFLANERILQRGLLRASKFEYLAVNTVQALNERNKTNVSRHLMHGFAVGVSCNGDHSCRQLLVV